MKLSAERWQRLMKLLPKWKKGNTWQSRFPDSVLAPLSAREMDGWICPKGGGEAWLEVGPGRDVEVGMKERVLLSEQLELGCREQGMRTGEDRAAVGMSLALAMHGLGCGWKWD